MALLSSSVTYGVAAMINPLFKVCPRCKEHKNRANFSEQGYCKPCSASYQVARLNQIPKICAYCDVEQSRDQFSKKRGCNKCKTCTAEGIEKRAKATAEERANHMQGLNPIMNHYLRGAL